MASDQSYRIVGALRLADFNPNFALAVACRGDDPGYWLQVIAPTSQTVIEFTPLAQADYDQVDSIAGRDISVGEDYIHAFVQRNGGLLIGTAQEIRMELQIAFDHPSTSTPVKLAISEHLGDRATIRESRVRVIDDLTEALGDQSGNAFINSTARSELWSILEREALNSSALQRIRKARSNVLAKVVDGVVVIDISAIDPADLRISFEDVEAAVRDEFRFDGVLSTPVADLSRLPDSDAPTLVTILEALKRSPRQEERISILLRSLILYPEVARQVMDRYEDSAQMARNTLKMLSGNLGSLSGDENSRQKWVAREIPAIVKSAYPRRRGAILYYLAVHLADFDLVSSAISNVTGHYGSYEVMSMYDRIRSALSKRPG